MQNGEEIRIDLEAAKALVHWKSLFAEEVLARAKQLAAESNEPRRITLAHYRQAAQIAVRSLSTVVSDVGFMQ